MTEQLEQRLSERLHAHPLPEEQFDLGMRSVRLGQRMRRRRIGAVVAILIVLITIPGAAARWLQASNTDAPPVTSSSTPPTTVPGPKSLTLYPVGRQLKAPPEVATVRDNRVFLPSGDTVELPDNQFGTIAEFGADVAWLTRTGGQIRLNLSPQQLPITTDGKEVTGVEPGPSGSVMVRTKGGPVLWTADATFVTPSDPALHTDRMVATAHALWSEADGQVTRTDMTDPKGRSFPVQAYPQWKKVVIGDTRADRVVVTDDQGCEAVLNGSTAELLWRSCDWQLVALSPDGQLAAARSVKYATLNLIDLASGQLRLSIEAEFNPIGPVLVFDQAGRLNLRVGNVNAETDFYLMAVDVSSECWLTTGVYYDPIHFVLPNRR